jgi:hypothetical protein
MKSGFLAWALTTVIVTAGTVAAHHSPAVFDRTKEVKLTGTVKAFKWQNPHTWLELDVPGEKGGTVTWGVEMTSPTYLIRAGWKNNSVKPGDKVTVVVNPVRTGEPAGIFISITLPDGQTLYEKAARLGGSSE